MPAPQAHTLAELAARFGLEVRGDAGTLIHGVGTLAGAGPGQLSFLANPRYRRELAGSLHAYLQGGGRKIDHWIGSQRHVAVAFDAPGDDPRAFYNANTLAELRALEIGL